MSQLWLKLAVVIPGRAASGCELGHAQDKISYTCPNCDTDWYFIGPRNPFKWECLACYAVLTWRETEQLEPIKVKVCIHCGGDMIKRYGRNGTFLSCFSYPDCKNTRYKEEWRLERKKEVKLWHS